MPRPLIILDLEATGLDVNTARIVEFAAVKVDWETFDTIDEKDFLINPGKAIPKESSDIHGIKYADVKDEPKFKDVAADLVKWMDGCDLAGYNIIRFDVPLLLCEFERAGVKFSLEDRAFIDGYEIFVHFQPHTLAGAYRFYCNGDIKDAHKAMGDVLTTTDVLMAQLEKYKAFTKDEVSLDAAGVQAVVRNKDAIDLQGKLVWKDGLVAISFGKHMGQQLNTVPKSYIKWMLKNKVVADPKGAFLLEQALEGKFAKRKK